jgi:hypothetical protein
MIEIDPELSRKMQEVRKEHGPITDYLLLLVNKGAVTPEIAKGWADRSRKMAIGALSTKGLIQLVSREGFGSVYQLHPDHGFEILHKLGDLEEDALLTLHIQHEQIRQAGGTDYHIGELKELLLKVHRGRLEAIRPPDLTKLKELGAIFGGGIDPSWKKFAEWLDRI